MSLIHDYAMFTPEGNQAIHGIVQKALADNMTWPQVYKMLVTLATLSPEKHGEATDTAVREMVYWAIGAQERGEDFYV